MFSGLAKALSSRQSLLVVSCVLLLSFLGLFYADAEVKESNERLHILSVNAERILNADLSSTTAVRLSASLRTDRYILNYQDFQDSKYDRIEENLEFTRDPKIRESLEKLVDVQAEIEESEAQAIGYIDERAFDEALALVSSPDFGRQKGIYRAALSTALREMIQASEAQQNQAAQLAHATQVGVVGVILLLAVVGYLYSREVRASLKVQSKLAADLEDANVNLEQRVADRTAELRESRALFKSVLDNLSDGIYALDGSMHYTVFNDRYLDIVNLPEGCVALGGPVAKAVEAHASRGDYGSGDTAELVNRRLDVLSAPTSVESEMWIDGERRALSLRKSPMDGGGAVVILTDITERKQAEKALRESEERLRDILDTSPIGFILTREDGTALKNNRQMLQITGLTQDEMESRPVTSHYVDPEQRKELLRQVNATGEVRDFDVLMRRTDGSTASVILFTRKTEFAGEPAMMTWVYDNTRRKQAEEELARKTAVLEITLENMDQGITLIDSDLVCRMLNRRALQILELPEDWYGAELTMADMLRFNAERGEYGPGDIEDLVKQRLELAKGFAAHHFERERPDGTVIDIRGNRTPGGDMVTTYTDITKRKMAERAVEQKEAQLRLALDNMSDGIFTLDSDLRHHLFNDRYIDLVGIPRDLFAVGKPIRDVLSYAAEHGFYGPGESEEQVEASMAAYRSSDNVETEITTAANNILNLRRTALDDGGSVVVLSDITRRRQDEQRLAEAFDIISSSIDYASNIQRSLLPPERYLAEDLAEHFVIWEPRDVVGGDLYWYRRCRKGFIVVLADCTGHGVPGAFMTMLSTGALDRALRDRPDGDPAELLPVMNRSIKYSLGQDQDSGESDDGLELGICRIEPGSDTVVFAGARFSLFQVNGEGVSEIKGDKTGIGYRHVPMDQAFTNREVPTSNGDTFYMTTDGLTDQIGGPKRRAFGKRRFLDVVTSVQNLPLAAQRDRIVGALTDYQGDETRRDDVSMVGFRLRDVASTSDSYAI